MHNAPHFEEAWRYARDTWDDHGIEELQRLGCRRFLDDLESGRWDFRPALPEFVIEMQTGLFAFSQGARLNGQPLTLGENDALPAMEPAAAPAGTLELAPATCTFLIV